MAAHRYWRLLITGGYEDEFGPYAEIHELELRASVEGPDQTGSGTASAISVFPDDLTEPINAFDDDPDTGWFPAEGGTWPLWLAYDFGAGNDVDVVEYAITNGNPDSGDYAPQVFKLQWSSDGTAWTDAEAEHDVTGTWAATGGETRVFAVGEGGGGSEPEPAFDPTAISANLRQVVYDVGTLSADLRQVVSVPTVVLSAGLRQVVGAVGTLSMGLRQVVRSGLISAGPGTQRVRAVVLLGGVDVSAAVTGALQVDREESAAAVAEFTVLPATGPIDLVHWIGAAVRIDVSINADPPQTIFTGTVSDPEYDAVTRTTTFRCTDALQPKLDSLPDAVVDAVAGGYFSPAVFASDATGSARAQDRLSTIPEALDLSPLGALRRTPWAAKATPDYTFTPDSIIDQSLRVEPGPWRELTNRIELTFELRYTRHRHRARSYRWTGPAMEEWIIDHTSLPTPDMIRRAAEENAWRLTYEYFTGLPVTVNPMTGQLGSQIINGIVWINDGKTNTDVLSANLSAYTRWDETVTETYAYTVQAPASVARFGPIAQTDYVSLSAEDDGRDWTAAPPPTSGPLGSGSAPGLGGGDLGVRFPDLADAGTAPNGDRYIDTLDQAAADAAVITALARAQTTIMAAHRANTVELSTPLLPGIDLIHTVAVDTDHVLAQGKVRQVVHRIDSQGEATTTVRIAVSQASADAVAASPLAAPPRIDSLSASPAAPLPPLGSADTHFGRRGMAPEDPDWTGYVGNYDLPIPIGAVEYTERFVIDWGAISRDPVAVSRALPHTVAVPHETLEIAA